MKARTSATDLVGQTIDRYEVIELLDCGGWAQIYKARQQPLGRTVVLKVLHTHMAMDSEKVRRFRKEAETATELVHENIASVFDFGIIDDARPYIVMEYLDGMALDIALQKRDFTAEEILSATRAVCTALKFAHQRGITHRDLKPSNVFLCSNGTIKLLDFGLAKVVKTQTIEDQDKLTASGDTVGTPSYMSPEQCYGRSIDGRSDIYSLGCMMYEMLSGETAFSGDSALDIMYQQLNHEPTFGDKRTDRLSEELKRIALKALAKDARHRFQTADDLLNDLAQISSSSPQQQHTRTRQWPFPTIATLATVAGAFAVLCGIYYCVSSDSQKHQQKSAAAGSETHRPEVASNITNTQGYVTARTSDRSTNDVKVSASDTMATTPKPSAAAETHHNRTTQHAVRNNIISTSPTNDKAKTTPFQNSHQSESHTANKGETEKALSSDEDHHQQPPQVPDKLEVTSTAAQFDRDLAAARAAFDSVHGLSGAPQRQQASVASDALEAILQPARTQLGEASAQYARINLDLGKVLRLSHSLGRAEEVLVDALARESKAGRAGGTDAIDMEEELAKVYRDQGDLQASQIHFQNALDTARRGILTATGGAKNSFRSRELRDLYSLGLCLRDQHKYAEAIDRLQEVESLGTKYKMPEFESCGPKYMARCHLALGHNKECIEYALKSAAVYAASGFPSKQQEMLDLAKQAAAN